MFWISTMSRTCFASAISPVMRLPSFIGRLEENANYIRRRSAVLRYTGRLTMKRSRLTVTPLRQLLAELAPQQAAMSAMLRRWVEHESPSDDKAGCDRMAEALAKEFTAIGGRSNLYLDKKAGNHLQVAFPGPRGTKPVLIVGHYDTGYDLGTLQSMPYREPRERISGPGVLDMKGGIVQIYFAIAALQAMEGGLPRPVTVFLVSDEETGSASSGPITEKLAKKAAAALVCEPAAGLQGALKTARKGVGDYLLQVRGIASQIGR